MNLGKKDNFQYSQLYTIDYIENPKESTDKYFELIRGSPEWLNI